MQCQTKSNNALIILPDNMQSDDVIWAVIGHQFCSYKVKYVSYFSHYPLFESNCHPGLRRRIFAAMSTTLLVFATVSRVPWPTQDMLP